ncbi:GGDEF and EAL domain-containing protein [Ideonella sp. A 288]|uniref:GGDEF and EAL domain-containing protein n=1 Tax=Ideonella sp. A 288 TaxID=1962181 RepID=UPI001302ED42|nr:GGDEF and EAL domain-containing protein [Ideonella sp. A 288]
MTPETLADCPLHSLADAGTAHRIDALKAELERLTGMAWHAGDAGPHLREQQSLLRTVLDESPDFIVLKDHEGNFLLCNKPVADFYGTTPEAMVGKHDGHFSATPEQAEFFRRNVLDVMARGHTEVVFEESTDDRSGQTRYFKSIKKPFIGDNGLPRILVIAQDITDIRRAQQQVQESERRLSYVLNATGEGVWDWDLGTNALQHNARWFELLGYAKGELESSIAAFERCVFADDLDDTRAAIQRCLDGHGPYRHEHRMQRKDGSTMWVFDRGDVVERDAEGRPLRMVGSFADVNERKVAEAMTERLAFYDPLTGLPNRRLMLDRLQQAIRTSGRSGLFGALMFIDLDNFKDLNDCNGHGTGDALLQQVGQRLRQCVRQRDTAARIGGDEFVLILEELGSSLLDTAGHAELVAAKVIDAVGQPYDIEGVAISSTPSIGIALFGAPADTADELLKRADFAMYQAKDAGRNTLRFFDPAMQEAVLSRTQWLAQLRTAIDRRELCIHLQPIVDGDRRTVGAEALVRWNHPERGLVSPADFIPLAEQSGLILAIGEQVLDAACRQLVAWSAQPANRALSISVNVSARQFHHPDFVARVLDAAERTGADPARLTLELTESVLLDDLAEVIVKMTALKARGVCFSIDDFGTGWSSLSYLKRLPLDELKIDRSFINDVLTDPNDASIVQTMLVLARSLSLEVVAEGVETAGQREFLAGHGCRLFQGWLYGRPMPAADWPIAGYGPLSSP